MKIKSDLEELFDREIEKDELFMTIDKLESYETNILYDIIKEITDLDVDRQEVIKGYIEDHISSLKQRIELEKTRLICVDFSEDMHARYDYSSYVAGDNDPDPRMRPIGEFDRYLSTRTEQYMKDFICERNFTVKIKLEGKTVNLILLDKKVDKSVYYDGELESYMVEKNVKVLKTSMSRLKKYLEKDEELKKDILDNSEYVMGLVECRDDSQYIPKKKEIIWEILRKSLDGFLVETFKLKCKPEKAYEKLKKGKGYKSNDFLLVNAIYKERK